MTSEPPSADISERWPLANEADRWAEYLDTVVTVEVAPGRPVIMNGPDAVSTWPFEGVVHVLTAWNPPGTTRTREQNEEANRRLAQALTDLGLPFHSATGRSRDRTYHEDGFVVVGADRDDMVRLASQFDQEAIFEMNQNGVHLLHCEAQQQQSRPRKA